jgi:hypothetical protein
LNNKKLLNFESRALSVFIILSFFFLFSCSKQESPTIETGIIRSQQEMDRLEACSNVNFNHGVLLHQNAILLFQCTKWDQDFPHMYRAMKSIQRDSWDHLMKPIDSAFFESSARRDRFFKNIRDLDAKNGLDDLSYVIVSLNETNFFDSTKAMFKCVDDQTGEGCEERKGRIPQKKSLKKIISLVDTDQDTIARTSRLVRLLIKALGENQESVRAEINKFRASPLYVPLRLKLFDAIAGKVKSGLVEEDRTFLSKVLLTGTASSNEPWIYQWFQSVNMNRKKFRDLLEYPVLVNPDLVAEFKGVKKAYDSSFTCTMKSTSESNDLMSFDLRTDLYEMLKVLKSSPMQTYFDRASEHAVALKLSTEVCQEFEKNRYGVNLIKFLTRFTDFLSEKSRYDLTKFLITKSKMGNDANGTFADNLYLADILTGNIFSSVNAMNSEIISSTREFYPLVFDILKNFPPEAYTDLGVFLERAFKEESDAKARGVADYWNFFTDEEKNFIFNFVDRHFDNDTNYVLLFDFYSKFLDDLYEVQPSFKEAWIGSEDKEEMSYLTLQNLFTNLAGPDTLKDFKKFFSRDQIIKVLEVISNGQKISNNAKMALNDRFSDDYIKQSRLEPWQFKVTYDPGKDVSYDADAVLDCMKKFTEIEKGFYHLVRNLPEACSKVSEANIAFRLYGWLNSIENSYLDFKKPAKAEDSLFNDKGLLSPYMLNNTLALTKTLDLLLGPVGSTLPTKNGISYMMESLKHHMVTKGMTPLMEKNVDFLSDFFEVNPESDNEMNLTYRNALVRKFTDDSVFSRTNDFFYNVSNLAQQYSDWVKNGKLAQTQNRSLGKYDPNSSCEKVINQVIYSHPCPSADIVKEQTNSILEYLTKTYDPATGSPLSLLLKAVKPGEGLLVPYKAKNQYKHRISLDETFRYFYDASDRKFKINNEDMKFTNPDGKSSVENVTTLARIETVINEVSFDHNYLGVAFLNAITTADDYNDEAKARKKLLSMCIKIPGVRCVRAMDKDDLRSARNALESFDSLIDINNGYGTEPKLKYGDFLRTFEQTLVASSAEEAQKVQLFPLKEDYLKRHNGKMLAQMTSMASWSNVARVIRDRVGRTREEFNDFVDSDNFKRVDRALLYGFDLPQTAKSATDLIKRFKTPSSKDGNVSLLSHTVDWVNELDYDQVRLVEDTIARVMVVGAYLGSPEVVFEKNGYAELSSRYKDNNLFQVFTALEKVIYYWPTLKKMFPGDVKLIDAFKPINTALVFFVEKLNSTNDPDKNIAYLALNDLFSVLQATMFDEMGPENSNTNGLNLLLAGMSKEPLVANTYSVIRSDYKILDQLHENSAQWFSSFALNAKRMISSKDVDFKPLRDYLRFTTKPSVCMKGQTSCPSNYHYDEPAQLVRYLNKKNSAGQTHLMVMTKKVLVENLDQLTDMLDDLLKCVKVKKVNPPLLPN